MAASVVNVSSGTQASGSSLTVSHALNSGTDYVAVYVEHYNRTLSGVTLNGVAMTNAVSRTSDSIRSHWYYMLSADLPTADGTSYDVVATLDGAPFDQSMFVIGLTGAAQSAPEATGSASAGGTTTPSVSITTVSANALALTGLGISDPRTVTGAGSGQTQVSGSPITGAGGGRAAASYELIASAGADTQSFTISSNSGSGSILSISVAAAAGGFNPVWAINSTQVVK